MEWQEKTEKWKTRKSCGAEQGNRSLVSTWGSRWPQQLSRSPEAALHTLWSRGIWKPQHKNWSARSQLCWGCKSVTRLSLPRFCFSTFCFQLFLFRSCSPEPMGKAYYLKLFVVVLVTLTDLEIPRLGFSEIWSHLVEDPHLISKLGSSASITFGLCHSCHHSPLFLTSPSLWGRAKHRPLTCSTRDGGRHMFWARKTGYPPPWSCYIFFYPWELLKLLK